jgi:Ubiquitin-conjugating enzyme
VKRILQEMKEMAALMEEEGTAQFAAEALESDIFEWHFCLRGPEETDYQGGLYHGRILLPPDYPFKPPSFIMLTPVRHLRYISICTFSSGEVVHATSTAYCQTHCFTYLRLCCGSKRSSARRCMRLEHCCVCLQHPCNVLAVTSWAMSHGRYAVWAI